MRDTVTPPPGSDPMVSLLLAHRATLFPLILIAAVIAQNTERSGFDVRRLSLDSALWIVLLIATVGGFLVGRLTARHRARRAS